MLMRLLRNSFDCEKDYNSLAKEHIHKDKRHPTLKSDASYSCVLMLFYVLVKPFNISIICKGQIRAILLNISGAVNAVLVHKV